ncbi:MAG: tetratricopeptide repeat protein [Pasteurellaceae bacterium]|nr:tetratricopeptide repeat protein [Pasteurellaceae bacterium]
MKQHSARAELNTQHFEKMATFAEQFNATEKAEWLAEMADRQQFEQRLLSTQNLQNRRRSPPLAMLLMVVVVIVSSGLFYWQTGRYSQVQQGQQALSQFVGQTADENPTERNDRYIVNLQNQLRQNPNNGDLWFELGQAYSLNNDFSSARICYQNAITVLGRKPAILGAMATADYYQHSQKLTPQAKAWMDEALKADPKESASLLLLASDAFLHNDPKTAISYWQQVLDSENQAVDRREIIRSIKMAEQRQHHLQNTLSN